MTGPEEGTGLEDDNGNSGSEEDTTPCSQDELCPENERYTCDDTEHAGAAARPEFRLAHLIRSWLQYNKSGSPRKSSKPGKYY